MTLPQRRIQIYSCWIRKSNNLCIPRLPRGLALSTVTWLMMSFHLVLCCSVLGRTGKILTIVVPLVSIIFTSLEADVLPQFVTPPTANCLAI